MAHAYTPGLKVSERTRHRCRRVLPIFGEVRVQTGDRVTAQTVVAETFMPGDVTPLNLANLLSLPPGDVPECMLKKEGDRVDVGDVLARTKGIFGFLKTEYKAKTAGTIETVSNVTGQVILRGEPLPVRVLAYLAGEVVEVLPEQGVIIEADVSLIQGIFGIGGETFGPIRMVCSRPDEELTPERIGEDMKGAVVIGGARMTGAAVKKAIEVGASAIVSGGIDDQDLRDVLGYDLGVAITGSEQVGVTLIVTEGFGNIAMATRTFDLLSSHEGRDAAVNGATQIRAGVMRPEIVIPLTPAESSRDPDDEGLVDALAIGATVRMIRDPYFGDIGTVAELPMELQTLDSGSKARVLRVQAGSGSLVTVPRANVEIIGG